MVGYSRLVGDHLSRPRVSMVLDVVYVRGKNHHHLPYKIVLGVSVDTPAS